MDHNANGLQRHREKDRYYEIFKFGDLCSCVDGLWLTTTQTRVSDVTPLQLSLIFDKCF